jgi:hypothetical protein
LIDEHFLADDLEGVSESAASVEVNAQSFWA